MPRTTIASTNHKQLSVDLTDYWRIPGGYGPRGTTVLENTSVRLGIVLILAVLLSGCPVPQKPGTGDQYSLTERQTGRKFYLYMPNGYTEDKSWPLVVTIHGWDPFDSAKSQIEEWQSTADQYGLIVIAPEVINSGARMKFRLDAITPSAQTDIDAIMAMMDYVFTHTTADPQRVLLTGWSAGAYLVHHIGNHYSERFVALCTRSGSFNSKILDDEKARQMAKNNFPVMIFYDQNDMLNILIESTLAIRWYKQRGFNLETMVVPQNVLIPVVPVIHDRHPEIAADFFMRVLGVKGVLHIVGSAEQGNAPLPVNFSVQLPHYIEAQGLKYLWRLDGEELGTTAEVYTTISKPGVHDVQVMVTERNGRTLTASRQITVRSPGS